MYCEGAPASLGNAGRRKVIMAVLVTGGAGYIGSHTVKLLLQSGYAPVVYDNLIYGHREAVPRGDFVQGDLHDTARLVQVLKQYHITDVMHFAGFAYVGESVQDPLKYYANNFAGTLSILQASATAYGLRWINLRYFNAAGADPEGELGESHDPETHLIPLILSVASGRRSEGAIFGTEYETADGTCMRV